MKKFLKGLGVVLVLVLVAVGTLLYKIIGEQNNMTPSESKVFNEDVVIIRDTYVNMYLLKGNEGYVAIDAGNNIKEIEKALEELGIDKKEVKNIVLTHSDMDHIKGLEIFEEASIYLPKKEEIMVNGEKARMLGIVKNKIDREYDLVEEKNTIEIDGLKIYPISVPGHTPGSTAYIVDNKYLFTGDILSLDGNKVGHFTELFNMDTEENKKNYPILREYTNYEVIFTGHHGYRNRIDLIWD